MYKRDGVETKERADERRTATPRRRRDDLLAAVIAHRQIVFQLANGEHVLEEEQYFRIALPNDRISLDGWSECELEYMT